MQTKRKNSGLYYSNNWQLVSDYFALCSDFLPMSETLEKSVQNRINVYKDKWLPLLKQYITIIAKDSKKLKLLLALANTSNNFVKQIIDKISIVYDKPPARDFMEDKNALYCYDELNINETMQIVNIYFNLLNDIIIFIDWNYLENKPYIRLMNRSDCEIKTDPNYPDRIIKLEYDVLLDINENMGQKYEIKDDDGNRLSPKIMKCVWTQYENYYEDGENRIAPPNNPKMENPYKIIPAVDMHRIKSIDDFWDSTSGDDLFEFNLKYALKTTLKDYAHFYNAFKMVYAIHSKIGEIIELPSGPDAMLEIQAVPNSNSEVGVLDLMNDFEEINKDLQFDREQVFNTYGISIKIDTSQPASGESIKIRKSDLFELREKQIPKFINCEKNIFRLIKIVWNYHRDSDLIKEDTELRIAFPQMRYFITPEEELKFKLTQVKYGIISLIDLYKYYNANSTDEEAQKKVIENISFYSKLFGIPQFDTGGGQFPVNETLQI